MQCVRYNKLSRYCHDVCPSGTGVHCDHTVHFSRDLSLQLDSTMLWVPDIEACPPTPNRVFSILPGSEVGYGYAK